MAIKDIIKKDFLTIEADTNVSELLGKLKKSKKRNALVFKKDRYLGVIDRRAFLKSSITSSETKVIKCTIRTPTISINADAMETAQLMAKSNFEILPVEEDDKIVGIVRALDLVRDLARIPEIKRIKVKDVKLAKPSPLRGHDKVSVAINTMLNEKVERAPIFLSRKLIGIVRLRDLYRYFLTPAQKSARGKSFGGTKAAASDRTKSSDIAVESFSSKDFHEIKRDELIPKAVYKMCMNDVWELVVKEDEKVFGLLTVKNILAKISAMKTAVRTEIDLVGLPKTHISEDKKEKLLQIARNESIKVEKVVNNDLQLKIHFKESQQSGKLGKKYRYSVSARLELPGQVFSASEEGWKVETVLRKCLVSLRNSINSRFKI